MEEIRLSAKTVDGLLRWNGPSFKCLDGYDEAFIEILLYGVITRQKILSNEISAIRKDFIEGSKFILRY